MLNYKYNVYNLILGNDTMNFEHWMLAAMEEHGYMNTPSSKVNRVARYLKEQKYTYIGNDEFIEACRHCNIDPYSFSKKDLNKLEELLKR